MASIVESVLQAAAEKETKFKSTAVEKDIEVEVDERNLAAVDLNPIDRVEYR
jgi:uncharacterized protein involved in high-affinity Fe2+ transport